MKKWMKFAAAASLVFSLAACQEEPAEDNSIVIDFEGVDLGETGVWDGSDLSGSFTVGGATFYCVYAHDDMYGYDYCNGGIAVSNLTDRETPGYSNQYSVYAEGGAAGSEQFGVVYYSAYGAENSRIEFEQAVRPLSVELNNSTYAYLALKDGNDGNETPYVHPMAENDWFKVTFTGKNGEETTGTVDFYLADFRDGKSYICDSWTSCDLSALGSVKKILISFDGTDSGDYGLNTPAYVCIDNVKFKPAAQ